MKIVTNKKEIQKIKLEKYFRQYKEANEKLKDYLEKMNSTREYDLYKLKILEAAKK